MGCGCWPRPSSGAPTTSIDVDVPDASGSSTDGGGSKFDGGKFGNPNIGKIHDAAVPSLDAFFIERIRRLRRGLPPSPHPGPRLGRDPGRRRGRHGAPLVLARGARARTARVLVSGVPQVPPDFEAWLAPYTEVRSAVLADPGDDAKTVLILTRFSSVNQIHRVTAPLGDREQLTFGKEPVAKARWLPGDSPDGVLPPGRGRRRVLPALPPRHPAPGSGRC